MSVTFSCVDKLSDSMSSSERLLRFCIANKTSDMFCCVAEHIVRLLILIVFILGLIYLLLTVIIIMISKCETLSYVMTYITIFDIIFAFGIVFTFFIKKGEKK